MRRTLKAICGLLLLGSVCFAKGPKPATPISELIARAQQDDIEAISELGYTYRKDARAKQALRKIVTEGNQPDKPPRDSRVVGYAKVGLARMGEDKYYQEFIAGISSSDVNRQKECIDYLGKLGDKRAVKHLMPLLDNKDLAGQVSTNLGWILPKVANKFIEKHGGHGFSPDDWKQWWREQEDQPDGR